MLKSERKDTMERPPIRVPSYPIGTTEPGGSPSTARAKLGATDYSGNQNRFPRISRPVELLRPQYDVVVIGSGYGGGVAASRMSRAGQSVCLLERGKERWPGEYPSNIIEAAPEIGVSGILGKEGRARHQFNVGDPTKLYQLVVGEGQNAFVGSGLGGTSLLNANVFLRADAGTMGLPEWPPELREPGALDKYYERAEYMLQPEEYPEDYPPLPKLDLLRRQAVNQGLEQNFRRVPQTTRFEDGPNNVGVQMLASSLTGMDSTGINDGSKSSTLVNYLCDAWNWGAEIFCETEVRCIKKHPGEGYIVYFAWHGSDRGKFRDNIYDDLMWIHAKKFVFVGAGALGTTEILLRSKELGLPMSDRVGKDMSGNGDILAFGYNTDFEVNGMGRASPPADKPIGPTITGIIDCRDQPNALDGFVIEEGAITEALVPVLQVMLESIPGKVFLTPYGIRERLRHLVSRQASRVYAYNSRGSLQRTQTYLIMSHDSNQAVMTLENGASALRFLGVGRSEHVRELNGLLAKLTNTVGGTFVPNPFSVFGQKQITVHPIGGASMSKDGTGTAGVVDADGRLLKGPGKDVHDGIVITDGSVIPTSLGVNPFATITALAERSVEAAARREGLEIDLVTENGNLDLFRLPAHPTCKPLTRQLQKAQQVIRAAIESQAQGIEFTEVMTGHIDIQDDARDFEVAANAARAAGSTARFFLSCHAWDIDNLVGREDHPSMLTGTFTCAGLPGSPYMVLQGRFGLFNKDPRTPDTRNLTYDFDMISNQGETIHFHGYKIVDSSIAFNPLAAWRATTKLYVTLTKSDKEIGKGILNIQPSDFVSELRTFSPQGMSPTSKIFSAGKFLTFFVYQVLSKFLGPLGRLQWPVAQLSGMETNKKPPTTTFKVRSTDGILSTLQYWEAATPAAERSPRRTVLFVPGASVDHQIFALPTIKVNAVEYFQARGWDIYCITHRVGKTPNAQRGYTTFDARLDIKAALQQIRDLQKSDSSEKEPIYVVAHCAGSVALSSGLLDGTIPARWLSGVTASNVFFNPMFGHINMIKASLPISLTKLYGNIVGTWFSCTSSENDSLVQRALNQITRVYPVESLSELCNSVVCHRSELVFGRLWSHKQLNDATHANLSQFLGGTTMKSLGHLMYMGTHGEATNNRNESLVINANLERLRGLPILFISGSENVAYKPESTDRSFTKMTNMFGQDDYEREVFQGWGHLDCWMGKDAYLHVYPRVMAHAESVVGSQS